MCIRDRSYVRRCRFLKLSSGQTEVNMTRHVPFIRIILALALVSPTLPGAKQATTPPGVAPQAPAAGRGGGRGAAIKSPEVAADGRVTFRPVSYTHLRAHETPEH